MFSHVTLSRILMGLAVALASFVALGTVAALWDNPFFVRMTPVSGFETALLGMMSVLLGAYAAIRRPLCSIGGASAACPVCNKILLLLFGGELLLTYFEPVRIYVAATGVLVVAAALMREWLLAKRLSAGTVSEPA
jgi:hypothetical protein